MYADNVLQNTIRQLKKGDGRSIQYQMGATLVSLTLPDDIQMLRIYPSARIQVCLNEAPASVLNTATFAAGLIVNASEWGTFALDNGLSRTLQMSTNGTALLYIDIC